MAAAAAAAAAAAEAGEPRRMRRRRRRAVRGMRRDVAAVECSVGVACGGRLTKQRQRRWRRCSRRSWPCEPSAARPSSTPCRFGRCSSFAWTTPRAWRTDGRFVATVSHELSQAIAGADKGPRCYCTAGAAAKAGGCEHVPHRSRSFGGRARAGRFRSGSRGGSSPRGGRQATPPSINVQSCGRAERGGRVGGLAWRVLCVQLWNRLCHERCRAGHIAAPRVTTCGRRQRAKLLTWRTRPCGHRKRARAMIPCLAARFGDLARIELGLAMQG